MSLLSSSKIKWASVASVLVLGLGAGGNAHAVVDNDSNGTRSSSVVGYVDQAIPYGEPAAEAPAETLPSRERFNSPLKAGTLTLRDVLEAHKGVQTAPSTSATPSLTQKTPSATAPVLKAPAQSSTTGMMLSEGMRAVLQKVGTSGSVPTAPAMRAPDLTAAQEQPLSLTSALATVGTSVPASIVDAAASVAPTTAAAPAASTTVDGVKYEPGQAPKSLGAVAPVEATAAPVSLSTATVAEKTVPSCDQKIQKWEKSCVEVGYPAAFVGKIVGETRAECGSGKLQDFWVANTCGPAASSNSTAAQALVDRSLATAEAPAAEIVVAPSAPAKAAAPVVDAAPAPVAVNGICGAAHGSATESRPSDHLCDQGVASSVSGHGPWTWACSGLNGGQAAACNASLPVVVVNGVCGDANGRTLTTPPISDLCASGVSTTVRGSGPWSWACKGSGGGSTQSCVASLAAKAAVAHEEPVAEVVAVAPAPRQEAPAPVARAETPVAAPVASVSAPVAASASGDLCGLAAETLAHESPDKDLCRVGSPSAVNGDGPWSWSCTSNEGETSECHTLTLSGGTPAPRVAAAAAPVSASAPVASAPAQRSVVAKPVAAAPAPVVESADAACGLAADHPALQRPASDLCSVGKASAVRGSGPWSWSCVKGKSKASCSTPRAVDASCGPANGMALNSAPFSGLCASGSPSGISGDGPWSWTCQGSGGGISVSCAAAVQGKVEGSCGPAANMTSAAAPTDGLFVSGNASPVRGDAAAWTWSCSGVNGGAVSSCSALKPAAPAAPGPKYDGLCGFADGEMASTMPSDGLCAAGTPTSVVGHGPWNWNCVGGNGGMTVSCTAPLEPPAPISGACGSANGVPTLIKPQSGLCSAGVTGRVSGKGPWTWTCGGANGGSAASCVAPYAGNKAGTSSQLLATPSVAEAPAASSLTTPRLPSSPEETIPSLDKKTLPSLTTPKPMATAKPTPSVVPAPASVASVSAPQGMPSLSDGSVPVPTPAVRDSISPAPALQEDPFSRSNRVPGNRLELDPTISTVLFQRGSGNIEDKVISTLDKLSNVLRANPDARVTLIAYADNEDTTPRGARRLSLTRALAVRDYLTSKGIPDSRIDVRAEGANTTSGYTDRVDVKVND